MKRITSILIASLLQAALAMAVSYNLKVELTPEGAGTLNTNGGNYEEGSKVNLRVSQNTGYVFLGWYEGDMQLSTATSFNYAMPTHDAVVTAKFEFDPAVPADPDSVGTQYTVTLECKPEGGGTFNTLSATIAEGDSVRLYAYTNTGYRFLHWEDEQGKVITSAQSFYYVMPHGKRKIYGVFEFDPEPPGNPSKNYWNEGTGEAIIDDFTPGRLSDALSSAIGDASRDQVTMITVSGVITDNDFSIANNYKNCTLLDLSRVTGITAVPSYAFDYTNLESVYLPSTIESIGYRAFYGCSRLAALTIYSMTPPALGSNVFTNIPEGLVIYVPAASIGQYLDAEGWSNYTILPIQEDVRSLTVNLPQGTNVSDYSNMQLEITNRKNSQNIRYVVTDKLQYIFNNVMRNTYWDIVLKNQFGDVFGFLENVEVKDEDVNICFPSLQKPYKATLSVFTPEGNDVTKQSKIIWYSKDGDYLRESASIGSLPVGKELLFDIRLKDSLEMKYRELLAQPCILDEASKSISVILQTIPKVNVMGRISSEYGTIGNAKIAIMQWTNGHHQTIQSIQASSKGLFEAEILNDSTKMVFSSPGYKSVTILKSNFDEGSDMGTILMERLSGIVINADVKTRNIGNDNTMLALMDNVSFTVYNKTTGISIEDFEVQNRHIIIPSGAKVGDYIEISVSELSGNYTSATAHCVIEVNDSASVQMTMQELGGIESVFTASPNAENVLYLYDSEGILVEHTNYSAKKAKFEHLAAGHYTLAAMGKSLLRGKLTKLSDIAEVGMQEGIDYVQSLVDIIDGTLSEKTFEIIPAVNESLFNYTSEDTYFQVNKLSVTAGQYVTLSSRLFFKEEYDKDVKDVKLIVNIPDGCEFVDNSLLVGTEVAPYTFDNNRITISLTDERRNDRVRFCVVPTTGGTHRFAAYAQFDCNGSHTQSAGDAYFEASSMALVVPEHTNKTSILVTGRATRMASVEIYDNGTLIGQTEALLNGNWQTTCTLDDAYNLSEHAIYAKIYGKDGLTLQTETQYVTYDKDAVMAKSVLMTFYNQYYKRNIDVTFDLQNGSNSVSSYSFNKTTPFTFIADLTNNDSSVVNSVYIHVYTSDENVTTLQANYNSNLQRWIAVQEFTSRNLPVNVSLTIDYNSPLSYDKEYAQRKVAALRGEIEQFRVESKSLEELYKELEVEMGNSERSHVKAIVETIIEKENAIYGYTDGVPDADFVLRVDNITSEDELLDIIREFFEDDITEEQKLMTDFEIPSYELENDVKSPIVRIHCANPLFNDSDLLSVIEDSYTNAFSENWDTKETIPGVITLSNSGSITFTLDFREILEVPGSLDDEKELERYANQITDYLEKLSSLNDNGLNYTQGTDWKLSKTLNNYHYALRKLYTMSVLQSRGFNRRKIDISWSALGYRFTMGQIFQQAGKLFGYKENPWSDLRDIYNDRQEWNKSIEEIEKKCSGNDKLDELKEQAKDAQLKQTIDNSIRTITNFAFSKVGSMGVGYVVAGLTSFTVGVVSWPVVAAGLMVTAASYGLNTYYGNKHRKEKKIFQQKYNDLKKDMERECCPNGKCDDEVPPPPPSPIEPVKPILDPSGFVYEAVSSNRLEGVTATVFQKVQEEDMYGDMHDVIVKWDAEDFGQINPEITDQEGKYAWDVPQGLWQVKFEKEGYETTYSEWLPVPPPQLDVNIEMKQNKQPEVKKAHAYEEAVEIEFDKYMMPAELNNYNIMVIQDGNHVEGTISLINEETSYKNKGESFASKVRFNATQPFTAQEVTLMVSNCVKSYVGIRMQDDFSQKFTVEREIKQIVSDSLMMVGYGEMATFTVSVLPALASQGKTLTVKTSSPMILGVKTEQVVIGNDGTAEITVSGELPGTAALTFSVEGTDKTAVTITNVEPNSYQMVAMPTASIASGSIVEKGTQIELYCSTEGAIIYYTTDGSCPCNETGNRKAYNGTPIVINETMTIKAIAVAPDMTESDVAEFVYIVKDIDGIEEVSIDKQIQVYPLPVYDKVNVTAGGKTIKSVALLSMNGVTVASANKPATTVTLDVSTIPTGIYIIHVTTVDEIYSQKILRIR